MPPLQAVPPVHEMASKLKPLPISKPPLGLVAVPLPMKNRTASATGLTGATADAATLAVDAEIGAETVAVGLATLALSRPTLARSV